VSRPRLGGLECIQQLRQWESASNAVTRQRQFIIVVSANCTTLHQQESVDSGGDDFHAKPINMATLIAAIEQRRLTAAAAATGSTTAAATAAATAASSSATDALDDYESAAAAAAGTAPRRRLSNILAAQTSLFSGSGSSKSATQSPLAFEQSSQRRGSWAPTLSFNSLSNNSSSTSTTSGKDV
jgi:hypothetical protein